jgi:hypothetical protein
MSIALLRFCLIVSFSKPKAVVLSHRMAVGGWGYPKSANKMVRRPAACWPPVNTSSAAYSPSLADATTHGMMIENCRYSSVDARGLMLVAQEEDAVDDAARVRS